ncbi:SPASM domain-containing protein [Phenylobacterium sp.]|jgi:hypothetical protein|uniref:SPASM domain-containing protein n=1 Tax=Phenylobacterium sp. TaxID=1871053 RepID=UPI002F91F93F
MTMLRLPLEGRTRLCLWPWNYVEVRTDGGVSLCCVRPPIGNLQDQPLAELRNSAEARDLRLALLSGRPDDQCAKCLLAPLATPAELAAELGRAHERSETLRLHNVRVAEALAASAAATSKVPPPDPAKPPEGTEPGAAATGWLRRSAAWVLGVPDVLTGGRYRGGLGILAAVRRLLRAR